MDIPQGSLQKKTSFFLPLLLLPGTKRRALEYLYRFCWAADDIADSSGPTANKRRVLERFKKDLRSCLLGRPAPGFWTDFGGTIRSFRLSPGPLNDVVKGVETDLQRVRFRTFGELHEYARLVAGAPGLAAMEIFGGRTAAHARYAENLGVFLQITNITRDFVEDRGMGRLYFPLEDFKRFGLNPLSPSPGQAWTDFISFQLERASGFWDQARRSLPRRERARLGTAEAIASVYRVLHAKLRRYPERILEGRVRLSLWDKAAATAWAAAFCALWGLKPPPKDDCGCG